jgi:hypothetical protein
MVLTPFFDAAAIEAATPHLVGLPEAGSDNDLDLQ